MTESGVEVTGRQFPRRRPSPKPVIAQIRGRLHVMHAQAKTGTGFDEFVRVVAVRATDDDDHVAFLREFKGRVLPLFRRLADGVNETHFRPGKAITHQPDKMTDLVNRLGGLGNDAKSRPLAKFRHVFLIQHHVEGIKVPGHAAHLDVVALADDDWMKTFAHQPRHRAMCRMHKPGRWLQSRSDCVRAFHSARVPTRRGP